MANYKRILERITQAHKDASNGFHAPHAAKKIVDALGEEINTNDSQAMPGAMEVS